MNEVEPFVNGIHLYKSGPREIPKLLPLCENTVRSGQSATWKTAFTRTLPGWHYDLGLPAFITEKQMFVVYKPTSLWY